MKVILSGRSAYEFWRQNRNLLGSKATPVPKKLIPCLKEKDLTLLAHDYSLSLPINVLVNDEKHRLSRSFCRTVMKQTGNFSCLVTIHEDFGVLTPELAFLQLANELDLTELIYYGYRFCAIYDYNEFSDTGLESCEPLMSVKSAVHFIKRLPQTKGSASALKALEFVADRAASPKEIETAMRLSLPYKLGGYKLPKPELNRELALSQNSRRSIGRETLKPDLYWKEAKLIAEYQSAITHLNLEQHNYDLRRMNAFLDAGYRQISINESHLKDIEGMDNLAASIAKLLGKRIRPQIPGFYSRQKELRCIIRKLSDSHI